MSKTKDTTTNIFKRKNTALSEFFFSMFFLIIFLFSFFVSSLIAQDDPTAVGASLGNQAVSMFGTREGINTKMFIPSMSDTPMTTFDGSTSFNARLVCAGEAKILEIFVQPSSTGDLTNVVISQDIDLNGSMDNTFSIPFAISGVCTNGIISCTPGTWNNCQTYKWVSDSSRKVELAVTSFTDLGGCYCINSSCGSDLVWRNLPIVLRSLGGGVVGAIHTSDSRMAISDVKIEGTLARYYGQNTKNCSTIASDSNVEQYYYLPSNIESGMNAAVIAQSSDPSSLYSLMTSAYQNTPQSDIKTCSITRSAMIKWVNGNCEIEDIIIDQCNEIKTDPSCTLRDEIVDGIVLIKNSVATGLTPIPTCQTLMDTIDASCSYGCPSDSTKPCIGSPPICTLSNGTTENCVIKKPIIGGGGSGTATTAWGEGNTIYFGTGAKVVFDPGIEVWGSGSMCVANGVPMYGLGYAPGIDPNTGKSYDSQIEIRINPYYNLAGVIYIKGAVVTGSDLVVACGACGAEIDINSSRWRFLPDVAWAASEQGFFYANYYRCPLVDGTECRGIPGYCSKTCTQEVCHDWWRKHRTYLCRAQEVDFSAIQQRARTIRESASRTDSSLYYKDYIEGQYQEKTLSFTGGTETTESCEQACKTRKIIRNTETTVVATRSDYTTNPEGYEFYYKLCLNNTCPLDKDESIVKDCQCINDFSEASVIMQTIRMGGEDFICSSGTPRPLQ